MGGGGEDGGGSFECQDAGSDGRKRCDDPAAITRGARTVVDGLGGATILAEVVSRHRAHEIRISPSSMARGAGARPLHGCGAPAAAGGTPSRKPDCCQGFAASLAEGSKTATAVGEAIGISFSTQKGRIAGSFRRGTQKGRSVCSSRDCGVVPVRGACSAWRTWSPAKGHEVLVKRMGRIVDLDLGALAAIGSLDARSKQRP